jgi:hypothetical protein
MEGEEQANVRKEKRTRVGYLMKGLIDDVFAC